MSQHAQAADKPNDSTTPGSSPTDLPPVTWYREELAVLSNHIQTTLCQSAHWSPALNSYV